MGLVQRPEGGATVDGASDTVSSEDRVRLDSPQLSPGSTLRSTPDALLSVDGSAIVSDDGRFEGRYDVLGKLGRGGMGEVLLCRDQRIGREIATKVLRSDHGSRSDSVERFQREARIQGQLEHPSVVPVYDLGARQDGSIYFTMQRVRGFTLEKAFELLRAGDPAAQADYTLRRLLGVFSRICLAVAFAHRRGVVHRDLKPANVILGNYGEVYLLDWGIAKVIASDVVEANGVPESVAAPPDGALSVPDTGESGRTAAGTVLGTVGYMAPEQASGDAADVTERADVYSLGAILFELLTLEPLHPGDPKAALKSTLFGKIPRPSERAPGRAIAPELDELCLEALSFDPAERLRHARELHERIERFLDGERDTERRQELARDKVLRAERVLGDAESRGSNLRQYAEALSELNDALALDPGNEEALRSLLRALSATPDEIPPGEQHEVLEARREERRTAAKRSALAYLGIVAVVLVLALLDVRSVPALAAMGGAAVICAAYSFWMGASGRTALPYVFVGLLLAALVSATISVLFGPLIGVPSVAVATTVVIMVHSRAGVRVRWVIASASAAAFLVPALLGVFGVLPASYSFSGGALTVAPWALNHSPEQSIVLLIVISLLSLAIPTLLIGRSIDAMAKAERRLFVQAWYFEQLIAGRLRRRLST